MNKLTPPLQQVDRTRVFHRDKKFTYFGGCDYFRLSSHPAVHQAIRVGLKKYGLNVAASRLTTGNHPLYALLERRIAQFFAAESATLVSSGYTTNLTVAQALAGDFTHVLLDECAHGCLRDAARFFGCPVISFEHLDAEDAARALARCGRKARPILLTDGLYSHDGEVAPLREYLRLLPKNGMILVDDAHAAGTIGKSGRGTAEYLGVHTDRIIQTITLSKAFGVYGGAILGRRTLSKKVVARSRLFAGNTPLALPLANAALAAMEVLRTDKSLRQRLNGNALHVKTALRQAGWTLADTPSPVIPVEPLEKPEIAWLKRQLVAREIFPSFIHYPGAGEHGYFRFALSSEHSVKQLDGLIEALRLLVERRRKGA